MVVRVTYTWLKTDLWRTVKCRACSHSTANAVLCVLMMQQKEIMPRLFLMVPFFFLKKKNRPTLITRDRSENPAFQRHTAVCVPHGHCSGVLEWCRQQPNTHQLHYPRTKFSHSFLAVLLEQN